MPTYKHMTIKFQTLKDKCIGEAISKIRHCMDSSVTSLFTVELLGQIQAGIYKGHRKFKKDLEDECVKLIERCDVRMVSTLAKSFPDSVPSWVKSGNYAPELTEEGWVLYKTN